MEHHHQTITRIKYTRRLLVIEPITKGLEPFRQKSLVPKLTTAAVMGFFIGFAFAFIMGWAGR